MSNRLLRAFLPLAAAAALIATLVAPVAARTVVDSTGRTVTIPDKIAKVFAAGPPASVLQYVLAPQTMTGWVRQPRPVDLPYLLPATRILPTLGRLTGAGDTVNLEVIVANKPDIILDFGTINDTYKSLADRIQMQTGVPYIVIDGSFANTPAALRLLGDILGVKERGEALAKYADQTFAEVDKVLAQVPVASRPRIYLARGPEGLETGTKGSINTEIIERVGGVNVVSGFGDRAGLVTASPEMILSWAPDTIVTLDASYKASVKEKGAWQKVPAVMTGRVLLAPDAPFGFVDTPPGVNRLVGLQWLMAALYPDKVSGDMRGRVREFYKLFYQADVSDADLDKLIGPAQAK